MQEKKNIEIKLKLFLYWSATSLKRILGYLDLSGQIYYIRIKNYIMKNFSTYYNSTLVISEMLQWFNLYNSNMVVMGLILPLVESAPRQAAMDIL